MNILPYAGLGYGSFNGRHSFADHLSINTVCHWNKQGTLFSTRNDRMDSNQVNLEKLPRSDQGLLFAGFFKILPSLPSRYCHPFWHYRFSRFTFTISLIYRFSSLLSNLSTSHLKCTILFKTN